MNDNDNTMTIKHPYRCRACKWIFWLNYHDIMRLTDSQVMPCGHAWAELEYAFDLDGSEEGKS